MPSYCCVPTCKTYSKKIRMHCFPKNSEARNIWVARIGNEKLKTLSPQKLKYYKVCENHFDIQCIVHPDVKTLKPGSLPTRNLFNFVEGSSGGIFLTDNDNNVPIKFLPSFKGDDLGISNLRDLPEYLSRIETVPTSQFRNFTNVDPSEKENNPGVEDAFTSISSLVENLHPNLTGVDPNDSYSSKSIFTATNNVKIEEEIVNTNIIQPLVDDENPDDDVVKTESVCFENDCSQSFDNVESINIERNNNQDIPQVYGWKEKYIHLLKKYRNLLKGKKCCNNLMNSAHLKLKAASNNTTFKEYFDYEALQAAISTILTPNQIKVLFGDKEIFWNPRELLIGFTIRYLSRKTFHFLREKLNYPLPSLSIIKQWLSTITKAQCKALMTMIDDIVTLDEVVEDDKLYFLNFAADDKPEHFSTDLPTDDGTSVDTGCESIWKEIQTLKSQYNKIEKIDLPVADEELNGIEMNTVELQSQGESYNINDGGRVSNIKSDLEVTFPPEINSDNIEVHNLINVIRIEPSSQLNTNQTVETIDIFESESPTGSLTPISNTRLVQEIPKMGMHVPIHRMKKPKIIQAELEAIHENKNEILEFPYNSDLLEQTTVSSIQLLCQDELCFNIDEKPVLDIKNKPIQTNFDKIEICQSEPSTDSLIRSINNTQPAETLGDMEICQSECLTDLFTPSINNTRLTEVIPNKRLKLIPTYRKKRPNIIRSEIKKIDQNKFEISELPNKTQINSVKLESEEQSFDIDENLREIEFSQSEPSIDSLTPSINNNRLAQVIPNKRLKLIPNSRKKRPNIIRIQAKKINKNEISELSNQGDLLEERQTINMVELRCQEECLKRPPNSKSEPIRENEGEIEIRQSEPSISNARLPKLKQRRRGILILNPRMKWRTNWSRNYDITLNQK